MSLDELDVKIIEILRKDSRTPFTKIAAMLGVSDSAVSKKWLAFIVTLHVAFPMP